MSMNNNISKPQDRKSGFQVPEGYFENFTERMMAQLPEKEEEVVLAPTLWQRVRPWAYMAAMFMGISLMVRLFTGLGGKDYTSTTPSTAEASIETVSSAIEDDEELMRYVYCTSVSDYTVYEYIAQQE